MTSLIDRLTDEAKRSEVVKDCLTLIDEEVADKKGLGGMAIKAGYKTVQGVKPGFVRNVVNDLLPEFARALDPMYQEATGKGDSIAHYFAANASRVADALLGITDAKAEKSQNRMVKGTYQKLRGTAKKNVESAVPRLGALVQKHAS